MVRLTSDEPIVEFAPESITLRGWVNVKLGEFEGVRKPLGALLPRHRCRDLFAPPEPGLAGVAVAEADEPATEVERAARCEASVRGVAAERVGEAADSAVPPRKAERTREHPQGLVKKTAGELLRAHRPYRESPRRETVAHQLATILSSFEKS